MHQSRGSYSSSAGVSPQLTYCRACVDRTGCSGQGEEHGYGVIADHPELKIVQLKQEAGEIESSDGSPLEYSRYPIGSILQLLPYHSCAAVACHASMQVVAEDGDTITGAYKICRGW